MNMIIFLALSYLQENFKDYLFNSSGNQHLY